MTDMAYLCVDKDGTELKFSKKPRRLRDTLWIQIPDGDGLPDGTIEKLIGRPLTWADEPYELKD